MFEGETSPGVYGDGGRELYVGGLKAYVYKCSCLANEAVWSFTIIQYHVARNFAGSNFLRFLRFFSDPQK